MKHRIPLLALGAFGLMITGCRSPEDPRRATAAAEVSASDQKAVREAVPPEAALERLKAGNARFVAATRSTAHPVAEKRLRTANTQYPFAVVVGCSDSRTPPEMIFDVNLGNLFVVRTAGNLVDDYGLGSVEYAADHLGVRLIVVMGHENCGAVKAAVAHADAPGHVGGLVRDIQPAVRDAEAIPGDLLKNAIETNARHVAEKIRRDVDFAGRDIRVIVAVHNLETGEVRWLD